MNYKTSNYGKKASRRDYSKVHMQVELPDLIEIQTKSFKEFVDSGLREIFDDLSPIVSNNGELKLYFGDYHFQEPKFNIEESKARKINFSRTLVCDLLLENTQTGEIKKRDDLFMGDYPFMTDFGTFVVNGAERVVVSQIVRSAGVYYTTENDKKTQTQKIIGTVIPNRGAWIEYETGSKDIVYAKLDRSKKIPLTTFLRSLGLSTNDAIIDLYGDSKYLEATFEKDETHNSEEAAIEIYAKLRQGEKGTVDGSRDLIKARLFDDRRYDLASVGRYKYNKKLDIFQRAKGLYLAKDVKLKCAETVNEETGEVREAINTVFKTDTRITGDVLKTLIKYRDLIKEEVKLDAGLSDDPVYVEVLYVKQAEGKDTKLIKLIGSYQEDSKDTLHITISDILATANYYLTLLDGVGTIDVIDHLGNRRLRLIGELLKNQFRIGFAKLEKNIKDRMSTIDPKDADPKTLVNIKPLTSELREFFGSSQLSQFMDQINPLAEITQKRRISALGAGGIARDRAGVEVRDVHTSHYGRMCPIETPEGPSIGLITSLSTYATANEYGFIETPYLKVIDEIMPDGTIKKKVTNIKEYLSADVEEEHVIAAASTLIDENGYIIEKDENGKDVKVIARVNGEAEFVDPKTVDYIDVSPQQVVSVAAACIPFLEHDDASRALMGANMQRQAVPLISTESPIVGTGMEYKAAKDSGIAAKCIRGGEVIYADSRVVKIKTKSGDIDVYDLIQFSRSNQDTCLLQRPIVSKGDILDDGDVIADGPSTSNGELALGKNVTIAFMTWNGYNYEDAVIMSEKLVKEDVYTSIHIDEYEIEARQSKLGHEVITREIPNVSQEVTKYLDERGVIIPGAEVKEGDILVGKTTPKGQSEQTPEEKLLFAIFGEKVKEVRDSSLRVPHGGGGVVQRVDCFRKDKGDDLGPGVIEVIRVYIVKKRKIRVGDKMAGRHGNKGVISNILPVEDMPFTKEGVPVDIMLNPQGVPSRMNIGQVLEIHLGMAAKKLGIKTATPVFDGATIEDINAIMKEAKMHITEMQEKGLDPNDPKQVEEYVCDGKQILYDGRTGEPFENRISVGVMYFVKLSHMVDDKLHARATGPYTLVTQQPMGGKAQKGGQRFGEMEVWALEAYGAAHTLQEMMTVKSDDIIGRNQVFKAITEGKPIPEGSVPESFRVLTRELQALGVHVELINSQTGENEANKSLVDFQDSDAIEKYGFGA